MHFLCVICVFSLIYSNQGQSIEDGSTGNCEVDGITDEEWSTQKVFENSLKDTDANETFFQSTYSNIKGVEICDKYFCIELDKASETFIIRPSDNFPGIDGNGDYEKMTSDTVEISSIYKLNCETGYRTLTLKIKVTDTNNHEPSFSDKSYSYKLPMPMSPKNSITNFGEEIIVTDIDFSNKEITCSSDFGDDLSCKTVNGDEGSYSYKLMLEFTAVEKLTSTKTFILKATDSGNPPKYSTAEVTFNIDEQNSEPPSFTKPSYLYDYDKETPNIIPRDGKGTMLTSPMSGLECTIPDTDYLSFFNDIVVNGAKVELSLTKPFDVDVIAEKIVQVTIQCFVNKAIGISTADVIILFPKVTIGFSEKKYTARYEISGDQPNVKMTDVITLTGSLDDIDITVDEDMREYLEVKSIDGGWTLSTIKNLEGETLKKTEISLIITLSKKGDKEPIDEAFITLLLPNGEEGIEFTQPYFSGECIFDENGNGAMDPIKFTCNTNNFDIDACKLEESDDYSKYFGLSCDKPTDLNLYYKGEKLPEDLLKSQTLPLSVSLNVKLGDIKRKVNTAILLNLSYKGSSSPTTQTKETSPTTEIAPTHTDDCSYTGWIIAIIVVLLLFIVYAAVTIFYYFKRIRGSTETDSYVPRRNTVVAPTPYKRSSDKFKDISTRRPTGFIRYNPDEDRSSLDSEVNQNTNLNKFTNDSNESFRKFSDGKSNEKRNIGFAIPPPPPLPESSSTR